MTEPEHPSAEPAHDAPTVDDVFGSSEPIHSAADLARDGIFDDDEIDAFLADLRALRRSDAA